jgi:hypothetical protein
VFLNRRVATRRTGVVMRERAKTLVRTLVFLLACSGAAQADPITYTITGQISFMNGDHEDFTGSFILSDPTTELFPPGDSRGNQRDTYTVTSFTLTSASYSLTGTGTFVAWWSPFGFNALDSALFFNTSGGSLESPFLSCCTWVGTPGAQPSLIFSNVILPTSPSDPYRLHNFTATPAGVPEPSALLLYGIGLTGLATFRKRASRQADRVLKRAS